jgi:predicted DNA-binding protein (MmcQ/YjbR family)
MKSVAKIRKHCLSKPGVMEDEPWPGDAAWKVGGKIFAICGGDSVTVKSTLEKQAALIMHPAISKAAYVGRFGWVSIRPEDSETLELTFDLIDESYTMVAQSLSG